MFCQLSFVFISFGAYERLENGLEDSTNQKGREVATDVVANACVSSLTACGGKS